MMNLIKEREMGKPRTIVFRVSKPFQQLVVNYLHEREIYLSELIREAVERLYREYEKEILERELEGRVIWKRGGLSSRLGATVSEGDLRKLRKVSELTGRSITDLLKEGLWKVIKENSGESL
jgi:hypothetical protein